MIQNPPKFRHHDYIPYQRKKERPNPENPYRKYLDTPIPPDYLILDQNNHHILNIYQFKKDRLTIKNLDNQFIANIFSIKDLKDLHPEYKIILP